MGGKWVVNDTLGICGAGGEAGFWISVCHSRFVPSSALAKVMLGLTCEAQILFGDMCDRLPVCRNGNF